MTYGQSQGLGGRFDGLDSAKVRAGHDLRDAEANEGRRKGDRLLAACLGERPMALVRTIEGRSDRHGVTNQEQDDHKRDHGVRGGFVQPLGASDDLGVLAPWGFGVGESVEDDLAPGEGGVDRKVGVTEAQAFSGGGGAVASAGAVA